MKWLVPENELDVEQHDFLTSLEYYKNQNRWIDGFPGSGKSVLLLYAAKLIKEREPQSTILFVEFTHALINMISASLYKLLGSNIAATIPVQTYYDFVNDVKDYDYILCDEVQDLPSKALRAIRIYARKQVIVAGDLNQSIYITDPQWREPVCTPKEINDELQINNRVSLHIIHRLTPSIMKAVNCFLPSVNIMQGKWSMTKSDTSIRVWKMANPEDEIHRVMKEALERTNLDNAVGILFKHHREVVRFVNTWLGIQRLEKWKTKWEKGKPRYDLLNEHLENLNLPLQYVGNGYGSFVTEKSKITLMTYHSSKGIDFDTVFLPYLNDVKVDVDIEYDKRLLMVAMTRSRQDLFISYTRNLNENITTFIREHFVNFMNFETEGNGELFNDQPQSNNTQTEDEFA